MTAEEQLEEIRTYLWREIILYRAEQAATPSLSIQWSMQTGVLDALSRALELIEKLNLDDQQKETL